MLKINTQNYTQTGYFYEGLLDWQQKYHHQYRKFANIQEATSRGVGDPLEEDILQAYQKIRILFREDIKDFWRVHPPLEKWQSPQANAEPDPHMNPNPRNVVPFLSNGSLVMTLKWQCKALTGSLLSGRSLDDGRKLC